MSPSLRSDGLHRLGDSEEGTEGKNSIIGACSFAGGRIRIGNAGVLGDRLPSTNADLRRAQLVGDKSRCSTATARS